MADLLCGSMEEFPLGNCENHFRYITRNREHLCMAVEVCRALGRQIPADSTWRFHRHCPSYLASDVCKQEGYGERPDGAERQHSVAVSELPGDARL